MHGYARYSLRETRTSYVVIVRSGLENNNITYTALVIPRDAVELDQPLGNGDHNNNNNNGRGESTGVPSSSSSSSTTTTTTLPSTITSTPLTNDNSNGNTLKTQVSTTTSNNVSNPTGTYTHATSTNADQREGNDASNTNTNTNNSNSNSNSNSNKIRVVANPMNTVQLDSLLASLDSTDQESTIAAPQVSKDAAAVSNDLTEPTNNTNNNNSNNNSNNTTGSVVIPAFFGVVGLIRFMHGYYLTVVTKCSPVALIGGHQVFHIDDTKTVYLPSRAPSKDTRGSEQKYRQIFAHFDLAKNFYFSYTYDLTRALEANLASPSGAGSGSMFAWNHYMASPIEDAIRAARSTYRDNELFKSHEKMDVWTLKIIHGYVAQSRIAVVGRYVDVTLIARRSRYFAGTRYLKRGVNDKGHVANEVETEQIVSDANTTTFYTPLDTRGSRGYNRNFTSFVQHRGSIPLFWTQDAVAMAAKPPIELTYADPFYSAAALHFNDILARYGAPVIVLNLVKAKEKTPRESILLKEFTAAVKYLNQFLPRGKKIEYIAWDMARASKSHDQDVVGTLKALAERIVRTNRFFHSGEEIEYNYGTRLQEWEDRRGDGEGGEGGEDGKDVVAEGSGGEKETSTSDLIEDKYTQLNVVSKYMAGKNRTKSGGKVDGGEYDFDEEDGLIDRGDGRPIRRRTPQLQRGVVRTNCIDCLDRTNAAQFIIGKSAFAHQLFELGIVRTAELPFDCDAVNVLNSMYHEHGDTIALQYGGSHLVNTMETYRKTNPWTSHSRDLLESIKRYYSNSFTDAEKQDAINVFLGLYRRETFENLNIWDLKTDFYLHNYAPRDQMRRSRNSYVAWFEQFGASTKDAERRKVSKLGPISPRVFVETLVKEMNFYNDYYEPRVFTSLDSLFVMRMTMDSLAFMHGVHGGTVPGTHGSAAAIPSRSSTHSAGYGSTTSSMGHHSSRLGALLTRSPFALAAGPEAKGAGSGRSSASSNAAEAVNDGSNSKVNLSSNPNSAVGGNGVGNLKKDDTSKSLLQYSLNIGGVRRWLRLPSSTAGGEADGKGEGGGAGGGEAGLQGGNTVNSTTGLQSLANSGGPGAGGQKPNTPYWSIESVVARSVDPKIDPNEDREYKVYVDNYSSRNVRMESTILDSSAHDGTDSKWKKIIDSRDLDVYSQTCSLSEPLSVGNSDSASVAQLHTRGVPPGIIGEKTNVKMEDLGIYKDYSDRGRDNGSVESPWKARDGLAIMAETVASDAYSKWIATGKYVRPRRVV